MSPKAVLEVSTREAANLPWVSRTKPGPIEIWKQADMVLIDIDRIPTPCPCGMFERFSWMGEESFRERGK